MMEELLKVMSQLGPDALKAFYFYVIVEAAQVFTMLGLLFFAGYKVFKATVNGVI